MAFLRDFNNKNRIISARAVMELERTGTEVNAKLFDGSSVKVGEAADEDTAKALLKSTAHATFLRA